jgi:transposase
MQSKMAAPAGAQTVLAEKMRTLFVGIDPHKERHVLSALSPFGDVVSVVSFANSVSGFNEALEQISRTSREMSLSPLFGIEDTGGNGRFFAEHLARRDFPVKTVCPALVDRLRRKNTHPEKSDSRDAEEVARALLTRSGRLPDLIVSEDSDFAKDLNLLVRDREHLVNEQTKLKNKLHAALQSAWGSIYKTVCQKDIFGKRAVRFFLEYPTARDFKSGKPDCLDNLAMDDLPPASDILRAHITRHYRRIEEIKRELGEVEKQINLIVAEKHAYLTTLHGCASVTAAKLIAEIGDISRFANSSKLARYSGIAPRKYESGARKNDQQSKRGNVRLRQAIKTIALTQIGRMGDEAGKAYYRKKVEKEGKGKKTALRCLMRQLTKIIFRMVKKQRPYY